MRDRSERGILGVFTESAKCTAAVRALRETTPADIRVFSPIPDPAIQEALGKGPSPLGFATLVGGITGLACGISLAAFATFKYELIVGGKPLAAWIPWGVIGFEFTILLGCLANFAAMILLSGLPRLRRPAGYDERFSVDAYGVFVPCRDEEITRYRAVLEAEGAKEVHERS